MDTNVAVALITGSFTIGGMIVKFYLEAKTKKMLKTEIANIPKLINHQVFSRSEMLKNHINMSFTLQNKGKEIVFKDLLSNCINCWEKSIRELAAELDEINECEDTVLFNTVMKHFDTGIHNFNVYYKTSNYTRDEQLALDIVMEKFNKWNFTRIQSSFDTFRTICNSQFYCGAKVKSAVIMDMFLCMLVDIINDAELTLNELNGDLKGLSFKGVKI